MSINKILDISVSNTSNKVRVWDLIVDNDFISHNRIRVTELAPGTPGQFLATGAGPMVGWSSLPAIPEPPGPPNTILQTNPAGSASVWNTDLIVPGTADITGVATMESDIDLKGDILLNGAVGAPGSILQTSILGGPIWSTNLFVPGSITSNGTITSNTGNLVLTGGDANVQNVHASGSTSTFGDISLDGNLSFNSVSGITGQYIKKTSGTDQAWSNIAVADLTPGINRQILQMNGVVPTWVSSITMSPSAQFACSGNVTFSGAGNFFTCSQYARFTGVPLCAEFNGITTFDDLVSHFGVVMFIEAADFQSDIQCGSDPGSLYQVLTSGGPSSQCNWRNTYQICKWTDNTNQDITSVGNFSFNNQEISAITIGSVTQISSTQFQTDTEGYFEITFKCCITDISSQCSIGIAINGSVEESLYTPFDPATGSAGPNPFFISCTRYLNAGDYIEIAPRYYSGTNPTYTTSLDPNGYPQTTLVIRRY